MYHKIEPLLPSRKSKKLLELSQLVLEQSSKLGGAVLPQTVLAIRKMLRNVNSYYSNLIESRNTTPGEIDKAMRGELSRNKEIRNLQVESNAHIQVQELIEKRIANDIELNVYSKEFIKSIHYELYTRLPEESRVAQSAKGRRVEIIPGKFREEGVYVGKHFAPKHTEIDDALARYKEAYSTLEFNKVDILIGIASAHHRFLYIHPFLDGNGRIGRLLSDAAFNKHKLGGYGLWNISRGLARTVDYYKGYLEHADQIRTSSTGDGRGNLSEKALDKFCFYFLEQALGQIQYMSSRLELKEFLYNVKFITKDSHPLIYKMIELVYLKGEVARKDLSSIADSERTGRRFMKELIDAGWLVSDTPRESFG